MANLLKLWYARRFWRHKLHLWEKAAGQRLGQKPSTNLREARMDLHSQTRSMEALLTPRTDFDSEHHWSPPLWTDPPRQDSRPVSSNRYEIAPGVTLFHDSLRAGITLHHTPLAISVDTFEGSFLSLVIDLPPSLVRDLRRHHVLSFDLDLTLSRPLEVFLRLNVKNGPNVEQFVREISPAQSQVDFDMFYSRLRETRCEQAWIDLIFEKPADSQIAIPKAQVSRRRRAEL